MNAYMLWRVRAAARRDAEAGVEADLERLVTAFLGPKPRGIGAFEDAVLTEQQGRPETFEALDEDIEVLDGALATHAPRVAYLVLAIVSFAVEVGASGFALGAMGYAGLERWLLAGSIALGTVVIARAMTQIEATRVLVVRWMLRAATASFYLLLVASAAWLRTTTSDEELSVLDIAASAVLLGVATGAPALVSHWAFARLNAAGDLHARRGTARRARRTADRNRREARGTRVRIERQIATWETEAAQLRAEYLLELRRAQASRAT